MVHKSTVLRILDADEDDRVEYTPNCERLLYRSDEPEPHFELQFGCSEFV
jgi:hypothetical protein